VRGRQPSDVREGRCGEVPDHVEEKEISNRRFIQPLRYAGMEPDAIQRVTAKKDLTYLGVIKRLYPEVIACAKQLLVLRVP